MHDFKPPALHDVLRSGICCKLRLPVLLQPPQVNDLFWLLPLWASAREGCHDGMLQQVWLMEWAAGLSVMWTRPYIPACSWKMLARRPRALQHPQKLRRRCWRRRTARRKFRWASLITATSALLSTRLPSPWARSSQADLTRYWIVTNSTEEAEVWLLIQQAKVVLTLTQPNSTNGTKWTDFASLSVECSAQAEQSCMVTGLIQSAPTTLFPFCRDLQQPALCSYKTISCEPPTLAIRVSWCSGTAKSYCSHPANNTASTFLISWRPLKMHQTLWQMPRYHNLETLQCSLQLPHSATCFSIALLLLEIYD